MPNANTRPMLRILADIRSGRTPGNALAREDRQAIVEHLWIEGLSAAETALLLDLSDRTIKRDRAAIREQNRITPGEHLARDVVSEMKRQADIAVTRIRRAVRDGEGKTVTVHMRIRAEQACFNIHRDLVRTLGQVRYIPVDDSRFMNAALLDEYEEPVDENEEPLTETQEILSRAFPWLRRLERKPQRREEHEEEVKQVKTGFAPLIVLAVLVSMFCASEPPRVAADVSPTPTCSHRRLSAFSNPAPITSPHPILTNRPTRAGPATPIDVSKYRLNINRMLRPSPRERIHHDPCNVQRSSPGITRARCGKGAGVLC